MRVGLPFATLLIVGNLAFACTYIYPEYREGSTFAVFVGRDGRGRAGVSVVLYNKHRRFSKISNTSGQVLFESIPPGDYSLETSMPAENTTATVKVRAGSRSKRISLEFPSREPLRAKALSGRIELPEYMRSVTLYFIDERGKPVASVEGFKGGELDTHFSKPGLYFLKVKPKSSDAVPIEISQRAAANRIGFGIAESTCGIMYAELCELKEEILAPAACFQVVDPLGAVISNAKISLGNDNESLEGLTKVDGTATVDISPGLYSLSISAQGFVSAKRKIRVQGQTCSRVVEVTLGVAGCTGKAELIEPREAYRSQNAASH
jgi:hypothetical protein